MKTAEKRAEEIESIMNQFLEIGIPIETPGVQEFIKKTKSFAEDGVGDSGSIRFEEYDRVLRYVLSTQAHVESRAVLESTKKARSKKTSMPAPAPAPVANVSNKRKPQRMCRKKPTQALANLVAME